MFLTVLPGPTPPVTIRPEDFNSVLLFLQEVFSAPLGWFEDLIVSSNMSGYWIASLVMFMVARFFLFPLFGKALGHSLDDFVGSDKAQKNLPKNDIDNDPYGGHI